MFYFKIRFFDPSGVVDVFARYPGVERSDTPGWW